MLEIANTDTLHRLCERKIELIASIFPDTEDQIPTLLERCAKENVAVALWPMLHNTDGRWANTLTMPKYLAMVRRVFQQIHSLPCTTVFVDLEPPIHLLQAALRSPREAMNWLPLPNFKEAREQLVQITSEASYYCTSISAAVLPLVLWEKHASDGWQQVLGIPVDGIPWEHVQVMMYSSLFEGYSKGLVSPHVSEGLVSLAAKYTQKRFGSRGGLSLGVIAPGALGDEQPIQSPTRLLRDITTASAQGLRDIAIFDLLGAHHRPPLEMWLDTLCEDSLQAFPAAIPPLSYALGAIGWGAGLLLKALVMHKIRLESRPCQNESHLSLPLIALILRQPSWMKGLLFKGSFCSEILHKFLGLGYSASMKRSSLRESRNFA